MATVGNEPATPAVAATPADGVNHVGVVVRCFALAFLLAALIVVVLVNPHWSGAVAVLLGGVVLVLTIETRHPLTLKNFFLAYTVALFSVGASLLGLSTPGLTADMLLFVAAFLAGYALSSVRVRSRAEPAVRDDDAPRFTATPERVRSIEDLLLVFAIMYALLLAFRISRYGLAAFYAGQPLVDLHSTYGQASVSGGLEQIVTFFLRYTAVAAIVLYVQTSLQNGIKIRYRYPLLLLVALPVLALARSDAFLGAWVLLAIYSIERRVTARYRQEGHVADTPVAPPARRSSPRRTLVIGTAVVVAVVSGLVIGGIRQGRLTPQSGASALERSGPLLKSELTPIQAYAEIKQYDAILGRTHGSTIVWPLLLKLVPRGFFPDKPLNTGAYYMSVVRPNEFAANYALPPTYFGDGYLSFGMGGAVLLTFLLGLAVARLDPAYREARLAKLPLFLIVFATFYAILRDPLSESLSGILIITGMWLLLRAVFTSRPERPRASASLRRRAPQSDGHRRVLGTV